MPYQPVLLRARVQSNTVITGVAALRVREGGSDIDPSLLELLGQALLHHDADALRVAR